MFDDGLADLQVFGIIRRDHPDPQDIGTVLLDHLLGRDDVAQRLRHLAAIAIHDKAVGENRVIRCAPACAGRFQQRAMEPAAMLV